MDQKILDINYFETPYSFHPERQIGPVRTRKVTYKKGYYHMEGVCGYEMFKLHKPIKVTDLQVKQPYGWETLMVDDPMHWNGMGELARLTRPGRVLTAGLGMGLLPLHLLKRKDIGSITIVEIDPAIIDFISALQILPDDKRIQILNQEFVSYVMNTSEHYDTIILDIWVLSGMEPKEKREWVKSRMLTIYGLVKIKNPTTEVMIWGIRGYKPKEKGK